MVEHHGALPSMNAAGHCYDNAMAQRFVARLKKQRTYGQLVG